MLAAAVAEEAERHPETRMHGGVSGGDKLYRHVEGDQALHKVIKQRLFLLQFSGVELPANQP